MNMIFEPRRYRVSISFNAPRLEFLYERVAVNLKSIRRGYETVNEFCRYRTANMGEPKEIRQFDNGGRTKTGRIGTRSGGPAR